LFSQRDQLKEIVTTLQGRKTLLNQEVEVLKKEKEQLLLFFAILPYRSFT
jgi:uncharacterized protein YdcH (DUF465 family)